MADSLEIIEAVNKIHTSVSNGFKGVYDKIDEKFRECENRSSICDKKVSEIEKQMAIKKALQKHITENKKYTRDYWQYIIRVISVSGFLALLSIAFNIQF